jgi:hypothetical protein
MFGDFNSTSGPTREVTEDGDIVYRNAEGELHREDGPAVILASGSQIWYRHGKYHRDGGPAAEWYNGEKWWCREGRLHREDGPAFIGADGSKSWWLNGEQVTEADVVKLQAAKPKASAPPSP